MKKIGLVIDEIKHTKRPKNIRHEFQFYGCMLCEALGDSKYSLYIKLAKNYDRALLEQALNFVKGYPRAKTPARLFMWKLKELKDLRAQISAITAPLTSTELADKI